MTFWRKRTTDEREQAVDHEHLAAWNEAKQALPEGWTLLGTDHEGIGLFRPSLDIWAASAEGPNGERAVAVALSPDDAYIQLARRFRGDLEPSEGWAPPL